MKLPRAAALLLLPLSIPAFARDTGTSAAEFLRLGAGPRAVAMGDAFTAAADDAFAAYWNPAGLPRVERPVAALMYNRQYQGIDQPHMTAAGLVRPGWGAAFSYTRLSASADGYDASGGASGSVAAADTALAAAVGVRLSTIAAGKLGVSVGAQLKWIRQELAGVSAQGAALDLGAQADLAGVAGPWSKGATLGAALKNLGPDLKFREMSFPLPRELDLGLAYDFRQTTGRPVLATFDVGLPEDDAPEIGFGVECVLAEAVALRLGWRTGGDTPLGLRAGFGLKHGRFSFDYAVDPHGDLGVRHLLAATFTFGGKTK